MNPVQFLPIFMERFHPDPAKPLVVAVSGGADSLCLVHLLLDSGLVILPAHYDHQLRAVSAQQAQQVSSLLRNWGLETEIGSGNVREYASMHKMGLEEAARICRYRFLMSVAQKHHAQAIVTAHHMDDQVETIVMHFLRGSGINGLRGMRSVELLRQFSEKVPVWRPLLETGKEEILDYCMQNQIEPIEDESNQDLRIYRNRLRQVLIPQIEDVQPSFRTILARNANVIELDRQVLEKMTEIAWQQSLVEEFEGKALLFSRIEWKQLDESIQYRLLMKAANQLVPGLRDLGYQELQRVKRSIDQLSPTADFKSGILIQNQVDTFLLSLGKFDLPQSDVPQLPGTSLLKLTLKKPVKLQAGWQIRAEMVDKEVYGRLPDEIKQDSNHAWLNPADLEWPLQVRQPLEGERWSPLGMVHKHQKMSDYFINKKIPRAARGLWPVVCSAGSVLWLVGLRIAQAWRLTGDEAEILHLQLIPPA